MSGGLPASPDVRAMAQLNDTLFCAVGAQLYRYEATGWVPDAAAPDNIYCLVAAGGRLYVGSARGVSVRSAGALTRLGQENFGGRVQDLQVRGDSVWAGTTSGLWMNAGGSTGWASVDHAHPMDQPPVNNIASLMYQPVGPHRLWMRQSGSTGVLAYDESKPLGSRWLSLGPADGLENTWVLSLLADSDGFLWLGHCCVDAVDRADAGLDLLDVRGTVPVRWKFFRNPPHNALTIVEDSARRKWIGAGQAEDSLYFFVPGDTLASHDVMTGWHGLTSATYGAGTLSSTLIVSGLMHGTDRWFGTLKAGLVHWRPGATPDQDQWVQYHEGLTEQDPHFIPGPRVNALAESGDSVWVGTSGGLAVVSASADAVLARFDTGNNLPSNNISSLAVGPNGDVWVGTDKGLALYRGGVFTPYTSANSALVNDAVQALLAYGTAAPYRLWIGTAMGLNLLEVDAGSQPQPTSGTLRPFPHPFRPGIHPSLAIAGDFTAPARVRVMDARGRVVREFPNVAPNVGFWDGRDAQGRYVGAGMYRVVVVADGLRPTRLNLAVIR
jgi:ligand-binding sensor domain-containing protein